MKYTISYYEMNLMSFLHENSNKTEIDFIEFSLSEFENQLLFFSNFNYDKEFSEIKSEIVNRFNIEKITESELNEYAEGILNSKNENHNYQKETIEFNIQYFNVKKNRFTDNKNAPIKKGLLNGKPLNLSERFKIVNKIADLENIIRKMNIADLEKYQLLAYILGCDKDIARDLMNNKYNSKDRDLNDYFVEIGLNK